MVATAFPAASAAGRAMLDAGGNAVDAAVAAAWALAVCEPAGSGLGGQTVMLVRLARGRTFVIDGHSRAPAAVSRKTVARREQSRGHRACTVATTPATLEYARRRYGRLSRAQVLEPAIVLAQDGYAITRLQHRQLAWCRQALDATPAGRRMLDDGRVPAIGAVQRQAQLAEALCRIAEHGAEDFYRGEIAAAIVADMQRNGGLLDAADLDAIGAPAEREPLTLRYQGHEVLTIPPPGGGVELALALKLLEALGADRADDARWHALVACVTHAAFAAREREPAHPDDWTAALSVALLSDERVGRIAATCVDPSRRQAGPDGEEPGETTHLCAADAAGNVVSLTQSIQSLFGAKVANDRFGFFYNNYLTTCPRRRHRYRLRSGAVPRSNAVPTLVLSPDGRTTAIGSAGSRRIVSSVLQVISAVVDHDAGIGAAIGAPRVHARLSGKVWLESPATEATRRALAQQGFEIEPKARLSYCMGAVQAVQIGADGMLTGAADPRRDGAADGRCSDPHIYQSAAA